MTGCACGQPVKDAFLCGTCTDDLRWILVTAAMLGPQLDIARSRQARLTDANGSNATRTHPLPYDPRAADAAAHLASVLRIASGQAGHGEIQAMALTLLHEVPRVRQRPDAGDILAAITGAVRYARRVIDRPPSRVYAGPCPACGADLLAMPGRSVVTCSCGQPIVIAERQEAMRQALEDHLGSAAYAARACTGLGLPVTEATIRQWVHRGKLVPHGGLLRIGDVITLAIGQRARLAQRT